MRRKGKLNEGKEEEVRTERREGRSRLPLVQVTGEVKGVEGRVRGAGCCLVCSQLPRSYLIRPREGVRGEGDSRCKWVRSAERKERWRNEFYCSLCRMDRECNGRRCRWRLDCDEIVE